MHRIHIICVALCLMACAATAGAHAPFLERIDFSTEAPFVMQGSVEKSIAVYAYLDSAADVDVYLFAVADGQRVQVNVLVPQCAEYEEVYPWIAVVGPGLPAPTVDLPLGLPPATGALVQQNSASEPPDTFYEPFSRKSYYRFAHLVVEDATQGAWQAWVWDPEGAPVDYVATIGFRERFTLWDILRSLFIVPLLWFDGELHGPCTPP